VVLDLFTLAQLSAKYDQLFAEHTRMWKTCLSMSTLHPDYRTARASMNEISELLSSIYAEIQKRTEPADA